jgi:hypothetical protein
MPQDDYLKYWRVIRYYTLRKNNLKMAELETLIFLRSEKYFTKKKFDEFTQLYPWNSRRFDDLLSKGWIEVFSKPQTHPRKKKFQTIYQLSLKSKRVVKDVYDKINGQEISLDPQTNPLFRKNVKYSDKVYRNMIIKMNEFIRQQRHLSQE